MYLQVQSNLEEWGVCRTLPDPRHTADDYGHGAIRMPWDLSQIFCDIRNAQRAAPQSAKLQYFSVTIKKKKKPLITVLLFGAPLWPAWCRCDVSRRIGANDRYHLFPETGFTTFYNVDHTLGRYVCPIALLPVTLYYPDSNPL